MGLPVYNIGTANVANGNSNVSFAGGAALKTTDPTTQADLFVCGKGDWLVVPGDAKATGMIASVTDATHLVLENPWQGTSNGAAAYEIVRQSVPFTGPAAELARTILSQGSDTSPDLSRTIDDGTARIKVRANLGNPQIAVGPNLAADAALLAAIQITQAASAAGNPAGTVSFPNGMKEYALARRNRFTNGPLRIWQRGTSLTVGGFASAYTADRWLVGNNQSGGPSLTVSRVTAPAGFRSTYAMNLAATGFGPSSVDIQQRFEGETVADLDGQPMTVAFDLLATTSAGTLSYQVVLQANTALDNGTFSTLLYAGAIVAVPVGFQRIAVTIPAPNTVGVKNGGYILVRFSQSVSAGNININVGALQAEKGLVANDFEFWPYQSELDMCLRYYEPILGFGAVGIADGGTAVLFGVRYRPKRVTPTFALSGQVSALRPGVGIISTTGATLSGTNADANGVELAVNGWSALPLNTVVLSYNGPYVTASSEL